MGTNLGGEVIVLDSAGYGTILNLTGSISIIAPQGVYAGISVFSGDGITINAGASDTVILRGLTVGNEGSTGNGIVFNSGGTLHIEDCVVSGFGATPAWPALGSPALETCRLRIRPPRRIPLESLWRPPLERPSPQSTTSGWEANSKKASSWRVEQRSLSATASLQAAAQALSLKPVWDHLPS
jgi:hypothetical protein